MFTDNIDPIITNVVATIGVKYIIPKGIGTVIWSYTDYEEQPHTNKLNNLLYFPESTFNILNSTALAESMKDDHRTCVLTKINIIFLLESFGSTSRQ